MPPLSDLGFDRLLDVLSDAPLVPEGYVDAVANGGTGHNPAFRALRWDAKFDRRSPVDELTPGQVEALQRLASGEIHPTHEEYMVARKRAHAAAIRLGAGTVYQALAVATALGIVEPAQRYVLGPRFRLGGQPGKPKGGLSTRQRQVLAAMANGGGRPAAAKHLGVSEETIHSHLKRIHQILGARDSYHAVALAVRHGIIR